MKNNLFISLLVLTVLGIFIIAFGSLPFFLNYTYHGPTNFKPGDPVFVLTGETIVQDGQACQLNLRGFISPTDNEGAQRWYKSQRFWFPQHQELSVILDNGSINWYPEPLVIPEPAPAELILCPQK